MFWETAKGNAVLNVLTETISWSSVYTKHYTNQNQTNKHHIISGAQEVKVFEQLMIGATCLP